jgi:hypothetical protein
MASTRKQSPAADSAGKLPRDAEQLAPWRDPQTPPSPPRKKPLFLIATSVLLAAWLTFLAVMAYISTQGASIP